jgi:hypothetical protein
MFNGIHLSILQKVTLLGELGKMVVMLVMVGLEVASYHLQVIEFQADTSE